MADYPTDGHGHVSKFYLDLANHIALVAEAIAEQRITGPLHAAVSGLVANVHTLKTWTPDDRS